MTIFRSKVRSRFTLAGLSKTELYADRKKGFSRDIRCEIVASDDASNMQLVVFVQEPGPGKVRRTALQQLAELTVRN